jgi:hypothetical protein
VITSEYPLPSLNQSAGTFVGIEVGVGVKVRVGVRVGVGVKVRVEVEVGGGVEVRVEVRVGVGVKVRVEVEVGVGVYWSRTRGKYTYLGVDVKVSVGSNGKYAYLSGGRTPTPVGVQATPTSSTSKIGSKIIRTDRRLYAFIVNL